jgi:hypothetical protein
MPPPRCPLQLSSIRDLLAVITSFSLLSLYVTYHLGFSAGRLRAADGSLGVSRQESLAYRDDHADSAFRSPQLLDLLFKVSARTSQSICCLQNHPHDHPFII